MKKNYLSIFLFLVCSIAMAQDQVHYSFLKKINLPGDGKWDYMYVDNRDDRLYVSHADRVHVIDLNSDSPVAEWTDLANVHGISVNNRNQKVYIANTLENNVVIYDSKKLTKITTVELKGAQKPDCILFDSFSNKAFVFCGKSNNTYIIDGESNQVIATMDMGGKPEFACTDNAGLIYNNIEDKNEVVVIDASLNKILRRYSLGVNTAPTGIAIDIKHQRLMVACEGSETMVVLSASTGEILASIPIGKKTDGLIYDLGLHIIVTSNGAGSATIIKQKDSDHYEVLQTLPTQPGLKTISYHERSRRIFLSGAELGPDGKTPLPDSFALFIYGPVH